MKLFTVCQLPDAVAVRGTTNVEGVAVIEVK